MHVVGVILADIAVAVVGQGQLVVLRAVQNAGLQGGVHITKAHGCGGTAQQTHHLHIGGRLLDANFEAFQVRGLVDGGLDGVEVAGARVQPGNGLQTRFLGGQEDRVGDLIVLHGGVVSLLAGEQIRQVEDLVLGAECLHDGVGGHHKVDGARLGQLHHLGLAAQQLAGVNLHAVLVPQFLIDKIRKRGQAQVVGVVGRLHMANADDPAVIRSLSPAASGQQQAACQCSRAHQRQESSSLHALCPPFFDSRFVNLL